MAATTRAIIGIIIVAVLTVGGYLAFGKSSGNTARSTNANSNSTLPATPAQSDSAVITYSDSGFSPSVLTVKAGTTITIKNTSSTTMQFDSDPHPVHTDDPELNEGVIKPGASGGLTVTVKGTHGYHNHLDPSQTGTIIVQ